jgi:hypothetical protein
MSKKSNAKKRAKRERRETPSPELIPRLEANQHEGDSCPYNDGGTLKLTGG